MLNINLETAKFVKNTDNTYTVYQPISDRGMLKLPRVSIEIRAEALVDEAVGDFWQYIEYENSYKSRNKTTVLLTKIKSLAFTVKQYVCKKEKRN